MHRIERRKGILGPSFYLFTYNSDRWSGCCHRGTCLIVIAGKSNGHPSELGMLVAGIHSCLAVWLILCRGGRPVLSWCPKLFILFYCKFLSHYNGREESRTYTRGKDKKDMSFKDWFFDPHMQCKFNENTLYISNKASRPTRLTIRQKNKEPSARTS